MNKRTVYRLYFGLILLFALILPAFPAMALQGDIIPPPGFDLVQSDQGVALYQKGYSNGSPDYVQVADLSLGAVVHVLHGPISNSAAGQGVYGGDNARFNRLSIKQFWNDLSSLTETPFCVTNGQFFRLADSPTALPFPLKKAGQILSDGYGIKEFPGQKLFLEIWPDRLDIRELTQENLYGSSAPDIVAGLSEDAEKASKKAVGRTFVGIDDRDGDRQYEALLIFNTRTARPQAAADVLRSFGADKVMMLDGGGSTQLICQNETYIDTERLIPQALGIAAGNLPLLAANLIAPVEIPVAVAGQGNKFSIEVRNRGTQTWHPGDTQILVEAKDNLRAALNISSDVPTGAHTTIDWQIPNLISPGLHNVSVSLNYKGELFPLQAGAFDLVLLPPELADRSTDLQSSLAEWSVQPGNNLASQVQTWLNEAQPLNLSGIGGADLQPASPSMRSLPLNQTVQISIGDIVWIPLLMIPMVAVMMAAIRRVQQSQ